MLGSHEQDLRLTEGLDSITTQLSIGHLELTEDLTRSLPMALESFDAVVIGDASLSFAKSLLDDILSSSSMDSSKPTSAGARRGGGYDFYNAAPEGRQELPRNMIDNMFQ